MKKLASFFTTKNDKNSGFEDKKSAYKPVIGENCQISSNEKSQNKVAVLLKNFFFKYWHFLFSALFITILYTVSLILNKVYPFGKNTVASYDMLAQICPFIEHLFDVIDKKASLFYTTAVAGGADVFGTIAYCLVSPFTPLFLLFGRGNVYYGVAFVLPLKLICIAVSALYFIGKTFPHIPKKVSVLLALLYTFTGYTFVANTYINWVDFLIYLPFVVIGFEKLYKEGKVLYFSISYALMIYTCFSIASFAMILVFMLIVVFAIIVCKHPKQFLAKSCIALLLSVAFALPIMVPAFMAYINSGRSSGLFENLYNDLTIDPLYTKITFIFADVLFVFLTIYYFIKNRFNRPIDRFLFISLVILFVPILIDESCNLLNAGSYMGYALRFGFLTSFYFFYVASRLINEYYETRSEQVLLTKKPSIPLNAVFCLISLIPILFVIFSNQIMGLINDISLKHFDTPYDFYPIFCHGLGGLEFIGPFAIAICLPLIATLFFAGKKFINTKVITISLAIVFATQLGFYSFALVKGNVFTPTYYDQASNVLNSIDDENYRIKDTTDAFTACLPMTLHTNEFSVFSSVIDKTNFTAPQFFDFKGNGKNVIKSANGMFLGDMLLSNKYFLHRDDKKTSHAYDSKINYYFVERLDHTEQENFVGYINHASFPNAFIVKGGDLDFEGLNYAQKLNKLYNFLGGEGEFLNEYTLVCNDEYDTDIVKNDDGTFSVSARIKTKESFWFMTTDFAPEFDITYTLKTAYFKESSHKLAPGEDILFDYYKYANASYPVTFKDATGKLTESDIINSCKVYGAPARKIYDTDDEDKEVFDIVWENQVPLTLTKNTFTVNIKNAKAGEHLFLNYVALSGHQVYVNGTKVDFVENGLDLMLIPLTEGDNLVTIVYRSPYIKYIVFGLIAGLLLGFACFVLLNKKVFKVLNGAIYVCAICLFIAVVGFFLIFPFSVFVVKFFKLIFGLF